MPDESRDFAAIALAHAKAAVADKKQRRHCKWVRLAAQRHLDDLKRSRAKDWPYRFDPDHANDICEFTELLPHVEGVFDAKQAIEYERLITQVNPKLRTFAFGWMRTRVENVDRARCGRAIA